MDTVIKKELVERWHNRRDLARGKDVPPVPFQAEPEYDYVPGKTVNPDWFHHGEVKPRVNAKGTVYGHDVPTGRMILPMLCSYCTYKAQCWPGAQMETKGGKPVWVQP